MYKQHHVYSFKSICLHDPILPCQGICCGPSLPLTGPGQGHKALPAPPRGQSRPLVV